MKFLFFSQKIVIQGYMSLLSEIMKWSIHYWSHIPLLTVHQQTVHINIQRATFYPLPIADPFQSQTKGYEFNFSSPLRETMVRKLLDLKPNTPYSPTILMPKVLPGSRCSSTNRGGPQVWFPDPTTTVSFCLGDA